MGFESNLYEELCDKAREASTEWKMYNQLRVYAFENAERCKFERKYAEKAAWIKFGNEADQKANESLGRLLEVNKQIETV